MKFRIALLIAFVTVALGVGIGPGPARAGVNDCPLGNFCIWTGYGYTGTRYTIPYNSINGGTRHGYRLGASASNHGRAFFNRTNVAMNIYDNGACGYYPWTRTMAAGQYADARGSDWTDRVSSVQVERYAPNC